MSTRYHLPEELCDPFALDFSKTTALSQVMGAQERIADDHVGARFLGVYKELEDAGACRMIEERLCAEMGEASFIH